MTWIISANGVKLYSSRDGLNSAITPLVERWLSKRGWGLPVSPYPSIVDYDDKDESMVLSAHLEYYKDSAYTDVGIVESDVKPYVADEILDAPLTDEDLGRDGS